VALTEFNLPGIIFDLQITKADPGFELCWSGSYGVSSASTFGRENLNDRRRHVFVQGCEP